VLAGLLLAGRPLQVALGLPCATVEAILTATGATRSRAYELSAAILALLPSLVAPRGRPPNPSPAPSCDAANLTAAVLAFVLDHPGCAHRQDERHHYSDAFRHFLLDQLHVYAALDLEAFAAAVQVPLGTLKDWLRSPGVPSATEAPPPAADAESLQFQTVLDAWTRWHGTFLGFCQHVREDLHVPFGISMVRRILQAHGLRQPKSRPGRRPDESALRGAFKTYFPGAQWVGDGMRVPVVIDGVRFYFNLELDIDAYSDAFVGISVRDEEDAQSVVEAFDDGVATTTQSPLALLLDNRPSNHTDEVERALGDTLLIRATPQRPQNKAHVEGAFGLFSQVLPPLVLSTQQSKHDLAKDLLRIVATLWACTTNHRPRKDRDGRSRVDRDGDKPSDDEVDRARRELRDLADRQKLARRTLQARRRPEVLALLDSQFARLGLLDPDRQIRVAIAGHPIDAILAGFAVFEGKRSANTLPDGADARYLHGIVCNIAAQSEGEHVARRLLELRLEVRDLTLSALVRERDSLFALRDLAHACQDCVDEALATHSPLERFFWLDSLASLIRDRGADRRDHLFLDSARRIHTTFAVSLRERHDAVRLLAERLIPIA